MAGKVFVLVHGAWHGGWCWRRVSDALSAKGHRVFTPTMTGLGERSHLLTRAVNLSTHIEDIANLLRWEELSGIVLCGHSYGGVVVTGVADRAPERVAALVYLDAFVPEDGQSMQDMRPRQFPPGLTIAPTAAATFQVNERDRAWVDRQCTPHPMACYEEKIRLTGAWQRVPRKTYIRAGGYDQPVFEATYRRLERDAGWRALSRPCGHDVMVDMPAELAALVESA